MLLCARPAENMRGLTPARTGFAKCIQQVICFNFVFWDHLNQNEDPEQSPWKVPVYTVHIRTSQNAFAAYPDNNTLRTMDHPGSGHIQTHGSLRSASRTCPCNWREYEMEPQALRLHLYT